MSYFKLADIVKRLNEYGHPICYEAADEIERLRDVLSDLRERSVEMRGDIHHFVIRLDKALAKEPSKHDPETGEVSDATP